MNAQPRAPESDSRPSAPAAFPTGPTFLDRGRALTVLAESLCILAWVLALLATQQGTDLGLLALILGAVGLILVAAGFFLFERLGRLRLAAGWVQAGGLGLALVLFLAIPGGGHFGKLAALLIALMALGLGNVVAHLIASLGLRAGGFPVSGMIGAVSSAVAIVTGLVSFTWSQPVLLVAAALSVAAHAAVLAGAAAPHPKALRLG